MDAEVRVEKKEKKESNLKWNIFRKARAVIDPFCRGFRPLFLGAATRESMTE